MACSPAIIASSPSCSTTILPWERPPHTATPTRAGPADVGERVRLAQPQQQLLVDVLGAGSKGIHTPVWHSPAAYPPEPRSCRLPHACPAWAMLGHAVRIGTRRRLAALKEPARARVADAAGRSRCPHWSMADAHGSAPGPISPHDRPQVSPRHRPVVMAAGGPCQGRPPGRVTRGEGGRNSRPSTPCPPDAGR